VAQSIKRSLAWMGGSSLLGQVITWSITIVVARLLTPADYGLVALSGLFTVFAISISEMGVGASVIQSEEISTSQIRSLYTLSLLIGLGMTGIGYAVAPVLAQIFDEPKIIPLTRFQSLVFLLSAAKSMQRTVLVRNMHFDVIAKMDTGARILTSISTLSLVYLGAGVWALAGQWLLLEFYMFLAYAGISRIVPKIRIDFFEIREVFRFGAVVMLRNITFKLYSMVDVIILGKLVSKTFLGGYTFSKQLTNMPFEKILTLVNRVLFPYFARAKKDLSVMRDWTVQVAELEALFLVPFFIMLFGCSEQVILLMLGDNWEMAIFPMRLLCVASIFMLIENYNTMVLTALGYVKSQIIYTLTQLVFIAGGMFLFTHFWGPEKSIFVWVVFYPIIALALNNYLVRKIRLSYRFVIGKLYKLFVAHGVLAGTLFAIDMYYHGAVWSMLAVKVLLGGVVYLLCVYCIDSAKLLDVYRLIVSKKSDVNV